jgi:signal transduction histidine kinase
MEFILNPFSILLILSGLIVGILSLVIAFRMGNSTKWVAITMLCAAIWGFFYGLELASTDLDTILILVKLQYIGISFLAVSWLLFAFKYTNSNFKNYPQAVLLVFLIPVLTMVFVLTIDFQYLIYKSYKLVPRGPFQAFIPAIGPWYVVHVIYSYLAFGIGNYLIWTRFNSVDSIFKAQTRLIFLAGLFPIGFNALYQLGFYKPYQFIDLTPFAFLFSYTFAGIAIMRYNLLSIKPIARNKIFQAITKGVLVIDINLVIVDFNPAIKNFFENSEYVAIGKKVSTFLIKHPEIIKYLEDFEKRVFEIREDFDNKERIIRVELIPLLEKTSNSNGTIILLDDITEEVKIKEILIQQKNELELLNDLKDKYFSIISHDLKGPIFGVKELIHLTQTGLISKDEFFELLPEVSRNMENVAQLLENLLAWTSSQIRGEQLMLDNFDIHKILIQQKQLLDRISKEKNISIILKEGTGKSAVHGDKNMIELVIRNLINNAIKFSKTDGIINLTTSLKEGFVKVCVEDYGKGISKANLEKINSGVSFTTRGENNETGTGLGLVLVNEYITKNFGRLEVTSIENQGSKFCIYIPEEVEILDQITKKS